MEKKAGNRNCLEKGQMSDLTDIYFIIAIINIFRELKKTMLKVKEV